MSYVVFHNSGVIDKRCITTMGVSSKDKKDSIGFFGTGLKYAISVLLRAGHDITIYAGEEELKFSTTQEKIRNDVFDIIKMNEQELAFTTVYGKKWQLWQAFRELYCNCLDENGKIYETQTPPTQGIAGDTIVVVRGDLFVEQFRNHGAVFITDQDEPVHEADDGTVYQGASNLIFYRGVRVKDDKLTLYKYNILCSIDLTEDRTAKYEFQVRAAMRNILVTCKLSGLIEDVITAKKEFLEREINWGEATETPSEEFLDTVKRVYVERKADINLTAYELYKKHRQAEIVDAVLELNDYEKKMLDKAVNFCKKLGYEVDAYPIEARTYLGDGVLALAYKGIFGKKILLSKQLFTHGTQHLARGLIEEFIHLRYGFDDCTREMQNHLFDTLTHLGAQVLNEPL